MTDPTDLQPGDRVRVTRRLARGPVSQTDGVIVDVDARTGFTLDSGSERSHYATAEALRGWCEQTVELRWRPGQAPACEHGSPARFVTLVDRQRQAGGDRYGDVEGPIGVDRLESMELLVSRYEQDEGAGRFTLAFLHADRCRTER
jgi:hypothetical protein